MKKFMLVAVALGALVGAGASLHAQDENTAADALPKVLVIQRENVKVGKDAAHEKNEAAFARAFEAAKSPEHYLAATTLSGDDEVVFFVGYESFAAWGEDQKASSEPKMQAILTPLQEKDGDYVSDGHQVVATLNDKWSYHAQVEIGKQHYIEVETVRLRPGHDKDWEDLIDLYKSTAAKMNLDESNIFYEAKYGAPEGTVLIFTPRASMADIDTALGNDKAFQEALGQDGQKKWGQLVTASVESGRIDLLAVDPEMSYPLDSWVKADPDFWKPKPAAKAAPKSGGKAPAKQPAGAN